MCGKPIHLVSEVSYSVRVEFLRTEGTHSVFLYTYLQLKKKYFMMHENYMKFKYQYP